MTRLLAALSRLDQRALPPAGNALARLLRGAVRLRALTAVAGVVAVTATLLAVFAADRGGGDRTSGDVLRVGVPEGSSIPQYLTASEAQLSGLPADREFYALVSFSAYLAPDRLAPVLVPVAVSSVFTRVPLARARTQLVRLGAYLVPQDVLAAMDTTAERKAQEAANYRRLLRTADDTSEDLRQVYAFGAQIAEAEATAYRRHCSCVYAAVVHGDATALRTVAARPETRVVDPVVEPARLDRTVFLPPLPEQTRVAEEPTGGTIAPSPSSSTR